MGWSRPKPAKKSHSANYESPRERSMVQTTPHRITPASARKLKGAIAAAVSLKYQRNSIQNKKTADLIGRFLSRWLPLRNDRSRNRRWGFAFALADRSTSSDAHQRN